MFLKRCLNVKIEDALIVSNKRIARGIWCMELEAPLVVDEILGPGQFINIAVSESWDLPLRRPMSIAGVNGSFLKIIYKIFGEGTLRLSKKKRGERINILGPLGNTFAVNNIENSYPVLVGGGVGISPILWIHRIFNKMGIKHDLILGAVTSDEHFMEYEPGRRIFLTTDDGSKGEKGTVLPTLRRETKNHKIPLIFACGPEPMLKAIHAFACETDIPCQMALESYMACGTGVCQGCVVEMKNRSPGKHSYHQTYSLVCCDGPVYDSHDIKI